MTETDRKWLRLSLAAVWLFTAAVSLWELHGQSRALLVAGGIASAPLADGLVIAGALVDALLGLCILLRPTRWVYASALAAMVVMTLLASWMLPELWLHPLGPLSKNLPIAVLLWALMKRPA